MENSNLPPVHSGELIEAIKDHSQKAFLKGDRFKVRFCFLCPCGCNKWLVDIGFNDPIYKNSTCARTMRSYPIVGRPGFSTILFRSLQQQKFPLIKLTQIKEQELCAN